MIRVGITDDKKLNRDTVKAKLTAYKEIEIVLEATNGNNFLQLMQATNIQPDVVLMDLEMPELDGIETIKIASTTYPNTKYVVLTVFEDYDKIFEAIKAGASGYLLKDDSAVNIIDAITNVHEFNGIPMSPAIARKAMELLIKMPLTAEDTPISDENYGLSSREMDVLKELVSGKSYKAIGEKLFISPLTVRKHVTHIYEKLHVSSRAEIINIAHKKRWV
jgi:DNA-binding NarL/FixJ family response regulator